MKQKKHKRILIAEVNWLGDVLFSTPFIRAVRRKFPYAHIACMIHPRCKEMLAHNPHLNELIIYNEGSSHKSLFGKARLITELRRKHFDSAILLHRSRTRAVMAYLAGIKTRVGYRALKGRFLTDPIENPDIGIHKVEYFLKLAESLGCDTSSKDYEFFVDKKADDYIADRLRENGIKTEDLTVVLNAGANWAPKRWQPEKFAELGDILISDYGAKIVISGAEKDIEAARIIKDKMKAAPAILAGKTDLGQLAALMQRADFVISGDTGPMHIAVAVRSNVIALFGPTSPRLTGPYGSGNYRVIQKDVGCEIPCYELDCRRYRCMEAITVSDVARVFGEMYRNSRRSTVDSRQR